MKLNQNKLKDLLRPGLYFCKDIFDLAGRNRLKRNTALKNLYEGERAFLLLTGESLQQIEIEKLKGEFTFGVGFIFLDKKIKDIDLDFYMNAEPSRTLRPDMPQWPEACVGPLGNGGIARFYEEVDKGLTSKTTLILNSDNYKYTKVDNLFKDTDKYFIKIKKNLHIVDGQPYEKLADLTKRTVSGGGSIFFSILVMMYMGFKEIYLCGAGYTYEPMFYYHFYDNIVFPKSIGIKEAKSQARKAIKSRNVRENSSIEIKSIIEKDGLFRCICVRRMNDNSHMYKHRILNDYARSQGVKIYNVVPDGFESPVYEKISWDAVVPGINQ